MRRRKLTRLCACALIVGLAVGGCSNLPNIEGPPPAFDIDKDISELQEHYQSATSIHDYYADGAESEARRNEFIVGRLTLINLKYLAYIREMPIDRAAFDSATDITKLGLDLATTVVGGAATKAILGAVSAGVTGSRLSVEKNFFEEKTASALVAQMNAQRKAALVPIVNGLQAPITVYRLADAVPDLETYEQAGTLSGALEGIQEQASEKQAKADQEIAFARRAEYFQDFPSLTALRDRIKKLTDAQALKLAKAMEPALASRPQAVQQFVQGFGDARLKDGAAAKKELQQWIIMDEDDPATIKQWSDSLDAASK